MDVLFSSEALAEYVEIWRQMKKGEELLSDDAEEVVEVMKDHAEFDPFWEQGDAALHPQEIEGYVVNPLIHTRLHVLVERQLLEENPTEVKEAYDAMLKRGMVRHEIIHQIAGLWGNLYFKSIRGGALMDESGYCEALKTLTKPPQP